MQGSQTAPASGERVVPALASLYDRFLLDPLIEVARCIALDVTKRPRFYRKLPVHLATQLESFRVRTGSAPEWLSAAQRLSLLWGFFGEAFSASAIVLRTSAVTRVERVTPEANRFAVQPVRDAVASFREHLLGLQGAAVDEAERRISAVFNSAIEILRSEVIARVFGFDPRAEEQAGVPDPALIEEIQRRLGLFYLRPALGPHRLVLLEQVGKYGAATIAGVLDQREDWDSEARLDALVANAYAWEKAVQALLHTSDPVRAWKDPAYREQLTPDEKEKLAHPSGEIDLKNTPLDPALQMIGGGGFGGQSVTWIIAVCCSTAGGDPCTQASEGSWYCCPTNVGFTCPVEECGVIALELLTSPTGR